MRNSQALGLALTPTLSRKRERGRTAPFIAADGLSAALDETLLPLAGEGGAKRRMRVRRGVPILRAG